MYKGNKILAVIPARSGSKGLKDKNIVNFCGKPLIAWSIEAALEVPFIDRVVVSTDSSKIAAIAGKAGADVPFLRPKALASDKIAADKAVVHSVEWLFSNENKRYDYVILLQPTSPLRTSKHIRSAIEYYFKQRKSPDDTLVSVQEVPKKFGWLMSAQKSGYIHFCFRISDNEMNRQQIPTYYLPNGAIYIAPERTLKKEGFYTQNTLYYPMSEKESIDIDTLADLKKAEIILSRLRSS